MTIMTPDEIGEAMKRMSDKCARENMQNEIIEETIDNLLIFVHQHKNHFESKEELAEVAKEAMAAAFKTYWAREDA